MAFVPQPSFVVLQPNVPVRLRVRRYTVQDLPATDPETKQQKLLSTLILEVTEVNGVARETILSLVSFKAQQALAPFINSGELFRRVLEITRHAAGRATEYEIRLL